MNWFVPGSRNPFERDVVCGKLQTPSVDFVIGVFFHLENVLEAYGHF